ncbi:hypothetical protein Nmel_005874 [Mimus melanotis]
MQPLDGNKGNKRSNLLEAPLFFSEPFSDGEAFQLYIIPFLLLKLYIKLSSQSQALLGLFPSAMLENQYTLCIEQNPTWCSLACPKDYTYIHPIPDTQRINFKGLVHRKAKVAGKLQVSQEHRRKYASGGGLMRKIESTEHTTEWLTQSETVGSGWIVSYLFIIPETVSKFPKLNKQGKYMVRVQLLQFLKKMSQFSAEAYLGSALWDPTKCPVVSAVEAAPAGCLSSPPLPKPFPQRCPSSGQALPEAGPGRGAPRCRKARQAGRRRPCSLSRCRK